MSEILGLMGANTFGTDLKLTIIAGQVNGRAMVEQVGSSLA